MKIGFIGLGAMGSRIAARLLKAGYELYAYDIIEERVQSLATLGARACNNPKEVAENSDIVIMSLPNGEVVKDVLLGENGVLYGIKEGSIVIDLSTIGPTVYKECDEALRKKNVKLCDAPVSGGTEGAETGRLAIMFGGDEESFKRVQEVLKIIGDKIFYVGPLGSGQIAKLVNNSMAAVNLVGAIEAMTMGVKAGLDPRKLYEIVSASSGSSRTFERKFAHHIFKGNFDPGFKVDLMYKDLEEALKLAKELKVPLIMASVAQQLFAIARAVGLGDKDTSSLIKVFEELTKVRIVT
ncbi:MAG: NAD(P)-dependent oxidoreductase [Nitrososphaerota archaeon]|nr:NAD(P)-dependent oxidoreductase [Nitrososphaerales archaeon]MDW8044350.1 NAD(P)-dependent oxidoreductase [Nitrososphaerota archaeon]